MELSVRPQNQENYSSRLSLRNPGRTGNLTLRSNGEGYGLGLQLAVGDNADLDWDYGRDKAANDTFSTALDYRPRHNTDQSLNLRMTRRESKSGLAIAWRHRLNARSQFSLSYTRNIDNDSTLLEDTQLNDAESLFASFETELWFNKRSWRADANAVSSTRGAIIARVNDEHGEPISSDQISLRLPAYRTALNGGSAGHHQINMLPPGEYDVRLAADELPMEYEAEQRAFRVRVAPAAATLVEIELAPRYGVSGQLSAHALPLPNTALQIWRDAKPFAESKTDRYGYYQFTGLEPGNYEIRYQDSVRAVRIFDDYLFDHDLQVDNASSIAAQGSPTPAALLRDDPQPHDLNRSRR